MSTSDKEDWIYEGFEELEARGFVSDYVKINAEKKTMRPAFTLQDVEASIGLYGKGTKMRFLNRNGYDIEREHAAEKLMHLPALTVKQCRIGDWKSQYTFEEVEGEYNSVMFEPIEFVNDIQQS
jgi:hypothetical protein